VSTAIEVLHNAKEESLKTKIILAALTLAAFTGATASSASASAADEKLKVNLVATDGFYVDNDPQGQSAGDVFGSEGPLRRRSERVGSFYSVCVSTSAEAAKCSVTLAIRDRGKIELAGVLRPLRDRNRLTITGGRRNFRGAEGRADLTKLNQEGSRQRVELFIWY
jgi:hypothetical protein